MEGTGKADGTIRLIMLAHGGDKAARDRLVEENMGLVWSIVRRFAGRGCETEDLFQIGSIGLIKAIDKFDTSYDVRFSTYAVPMIAGEIRRFLRDDGMIKVSRSVKEMGIKVSAAREKLAGTLGREPTLQAARRWQRRWRQAPRWNHFTPRQAGMAQICPSWTGFPRRVGKTKRCWTGWY